MYFKIVVIERLFYQNIKFLTNLGPNLGEMENYISEANIDWLADQSEGTRKFCEKGEKGLTTIVFTNPQFFIISIDPTNVLSTNSLLTLDYVLQKSNLQPVFVGNISNEMVFEQNNCLI